MTRYSSGDGGSQRIRALKEKEEKRGHSVHDNSSQLDTKDIRIRTSGKQAKSAIGGRERTKV